MMMLVCVHVCNGEGGEEEGSLLQRTNAALKPCPQ